MVMWTSISRTAPVPRFLSAMWTQRGEGPPSPLRGFQTLAAGDGVSGSKGDMQVLGREAPSIL